MQSDDNLREAKAQVIAWRFGREWSSNFLWNANERRVQPAQSMYAERNEMQETNKARRNGLAVVSMKLIGQW